MLFTETEQQQLASKGITPQQAAEQIETLTTGIPFVTLQAPASVENGILKIPLSEQNRLVSKFENAKNQLDLLKFIPASGAASRMFTPLLSFLDTFNPQKETPDAYINRNEAPELQAFFTNLEKFPFYEEVQQRLAKKYPHFNKHTDDERKYGFVREMLSEEGLHYGSYPKALLPFHRYGKHTATALEEHLLEAALYAASNGLAQLHITIGEGKQPHFTRVFKQAKTSVTRKTGITFQLSFSYQKPHTNSLVVTRQNRPLKDKNGKLYLQPSGHGALLENLQEQDADIIFIKNIDNVAVDSYAAEGAFYKKMIAGKLLELQKTLFEYAALLDERTPAPGEIKTIREFLTNAFHHSFPTDFEQLPRDKQVAHFKKQLNRPLRVCGMVANQGEPGGGPFWVQHPGGHRSLQIVEAAQVAMKNPVQRAIFENATHFNPVDLVCGIKNYQGQTYCLSHFSDATQGFIIQKTIEGQPVKALERPGLWNGGMAYWNTVFVEAPRSTFNPVKTVTDLLKAAHQEG